MGAIELQANGPVGTVGRTAYAKAWDAGLIVRPIGDSLAMSPPLTITSDLIDEIGATLRQVLV